MKKKLIAYDLDGTLADTRRDIICGVRYMLQAMNKPDLSDREIELCVGRGLMHLVSSVLGEKSAETVREGAEHLRAYYSEHLTDHTVLYPNAIHVLEWFSDRTQVVVTNKPEPFTSRILEYLEIAKFFSGVYTGADGIPRKPDPGVFAHLLRRYSLSEHEVLFIGDSSVDIETGRRAGVETVIMKHGFADGGGLTEADHQVDDFNALLELSKLKGW